MCEGFIFYLKPHRSFDSIFKEYGVEEKVTPEMLDEWTNIVTDTFLETKDEDKCIKRLIPEARKFGRRLGVSEEKLSAFTKDMVRTSLFYLQAVIIINNIIKQESEG